MRRGGEGRAPSRRRVGKKKHTVRRSDRRSREKHRPPPTQCAISHLTRKKELTSPGCGGLTGFSTHTNPGPVNISHPGASWRGANPVLGLLAPINKMSSGRDPRRELARRARTGEGAVRPPHPHGLRERSHPNILICSAFARRLSRRARREKKLAVNYWVRTFRAARESDRPERLSSKRHAIHVIALDLLPINRAAIHFCSSYTMNSCLFLFFLFLSCPHVCRLHLSSCLDCHVVWVVPWFPNPPPPFVLVEHGHVGGCVQMGDFRGRPTSKDKGLESWWCCSLPCKPPNHLPCAKCGWIYMVTTWDVVLRTTFTKSTRYADTVLVR